MMESRVTVIEGRVEVCWSTLQCSFDFLIRAQELQAEVHEGFDNTEDAVHYEAGVTREVVHTVVTMEAEATRDAAYIIAHEESEATREVVEVR